MKEIFTPKMTNWLLFLIFGLVIPIAGQGIIANLISELNPNPSYVDGQIVESGSPVLAVIILSLLFFAYAIVFSYQIWFVAKLKTHSSVFALALTIALPTFIVLAVPLIFGLI